MVTNTLYLTKALNDTIRSIKILELAGSRSTAGKENLLHHEVA